MAAHPLDAAPAGRAAHELQLMLLQLFKQENPDTFDALADGQLAPMLNDMLIRGSGWATRLADAEDAGRPGTAHDVALVAWAYHAQAIHMNRGGRQLEAFHRVAMANRFFGVALGRVMHAKLGDRTVGSLFDSDARKAAIDRMHDEGKTDAQIGAELHISAERVGRIRRKAAP